MFTRAAVIEVRNYDRDEKVLGNREAVTTLYEDSGVELRTAKTEWNLETAMPPSYSPSPPHPLRKTDITCRGYFM